MPVLAQRSRQKPQQGRLYSKTLPAPIGGLNAISSASDMPLTDCVLLFNLIASEYGLRSRLGNREWVTGIGSSVRSIVPFTGSTDSGANNKLFACATDGIYDASASTTTPTRMIAFGTSDTNSGFGICTVVPTAGGHFLAYTDESNGYYVYSETNNSWVKVTQATNVAWVKNTAYALNDRVTNGGLTYICITAGTSQNTDYAGPYGSAADITDGTVHWQYTPTITGVDPAKFAFVMMWKNRLWFVEKNTPRAWYLGLNNLTGIATSINFAGKFRAGGSLRGLWSWTIDGATGPDDKLVAISGGADVVVYEGTDPSSASTFRIVGAGFVGGVPAGRNIATSYGGEMLILSAIGIVPLSQLLLGKPIEDSAQYATFKISNLFNRFMSERRTYTGWSIRIHPEDKALIVTVPTTTSEAATEQLVMATDTKSWSRYRDLPIYSCEAWNGQFYFGTVDGRVCQNTGYVDGVRLADPTAYAPVKWAFLSAFSDLGTSQQKRIVMFKPSIISENPPVSFNVAAKYGFDFSELDPAADVTPGSNSWDIGIWDQAVWGGDYAPQQEFRGGSGMGVEVAVAMNGTALGRTIIAGVTVYYDQGGFL